MTVPAVGIIAAVFVGVLAASRLRVPLGWALTAGGILLDVFAGARAGDVAAHVRDAALSWRLWLLVVVVGLMVEFCRAMTRPDNVGSLVAALTRWGGRHGRAWALMLVPAVIGTLPLPGGALFSAPFVQHAASGTPVWTADWKTAVNYWFRHVLEFWWPLYPGVIVALSLFKLEPWRIVGTQWVFTPLAMLVGYAVLIRPHRRELADVRPEGGGANRRAWFLGALLLTVVGCALLLPPLMARGLPSMAVENRKLVAVIAGLVVASLAILIDERRTGEGVLFRGGLSRESRRILPTVAGVMMFQSLLRASGLIDSACREMAAWGIPPVCAVALLPFLAGLVTGIAVGFTGTAFPLVVEMMDRSGGDLTPLATFALAFGFGHAGMMLSPVHVCLVATSDFFSSSMRKTLRLLLPCVGFMLAMAILVYVCLTALGL